MKSLSVLIFCKDEVKGAMTLAQDVYDIADEVVMIDSSTKINRKYLSSQKKKLKLDKLRIFYIVPLGLPEPCRMYGVKKCNSEWILYLDTDERLNKELKNDIRKLINRSDCSAFIINRPLEFIDDSISSVGDKQLRLYKRNSVLYRGTLHEFPEISGKTVTLPNNYEIMHQHQTEQNEIMKLNKRCIPVEMLTKRLSYNDFVKLVKRRGYSGWLSGYAVLKTKLTDRRMTDELTRSDYRFLILLQIGANILRNFSLRKLLDTKEFAYTWRSEEHKLDEFFKVPEKERKLQLDIAKDIERAGGEIKYLNLDKEKTITELNNKYSNNNIQAETNKGERGIALFEKLLREKYYERHKNI